MALIRDSDLTRPVSATSELPLNMPLTYIPPTALTPNASTGAYRTFLLLEVSPRSPKGSPKGSADSHYSQEGPSIERGCPAERGNLS